MPKRRRDRFGCRQADMACVATIAEWYRAAGLVAALESRGSRISIRRDVCGSFQREMLAAKNGRLTIEPVDRKRSAKPACGVGAGQRPDHKAQFGSVKP